MAIETIKRINRRVEMAKSESDFTYFYALLLLGEAVVKLTVLGLVAGIEDDRERHRYRLLYTLARSDGLGDWVRVLDDALTGRASQYLLQEARDVQTELIRPCKSGEWQHEAVARLHFCLQTLAVPSEEVQTKTDLRRWFRLFTNLRNKTRGHGATLPQKAAKVAESLEQSICLISDNLSLFNRSWAYLHRNLSGKYRVTYIGSPHAAFEAAKKGTESLGEDGVYIVYDRPRFVALMASDPELQDFFLANGGWNAKSFEHLSYSTDSKLDGDASKYLIPPENLPPSETAGRGELVAVGQCFTNVPDALPEYVQRPRLEDRLCRLLLDEKRTIVTLLGRGGIGKTSLALKVIHRLCLEGGFESIVWFSARDVDLQLSGPKAVKPSVVSPADIAVHYASLVLSQSDQKKKGFDPRAFFEGQLQRCETGPCLFVFDNFETMHSPVDTFQWLDTFIRPPNKILITTRLRDFKGDYPEEVEGMEEAEARALIAQTAKRLGLERTLTREYQDSLVAESGGHPYVIKVLLGDAAANGRPGHIPRVVAGSDEILSALFERTYASLSPCAQRAFLTLAGWRSHVPRIALEAVLVQSTAERQEVERGVESLLQFSLAEVRMSQDGEEFVGLPLVAAVFGTKKLNVSASRSAIQSDVEILRLLGPSGSSGGHFSLEKRLATFVAMAAKQSNAASFMETYLPVLEMICRRHLPGWLLLARFYLELGSDVGLEKAKDALRRFLEADAGSVAAVEAWRMLAHACFQSGDPLGEIHAFIERSQVPSVGFHDLSSTASRLNQLLRGHELVMSNEEKRLLVLRLITAMERRSSEATATDLSRMAWLALHVGDESKARSFVERGLQLDPRDEHCLRLSDRFMQRGSGKQLR